MEPSSQRVLVRGRCEKPCPSCAFCAAAGDAPLEVALAADGADELVLGGGDVTRWRPLPALLARNAARARPQRVWVEAPAGSLSPEVLAALARRGAAGVVVQVEGAGEKQVRALGVGDGAAVVARAEALGLQARVNLFARPATFGALLELGARLAPRPVGLELVREGWDGSATALWPESIATALRRAPNVRFRGERAGNRGYLPPCAMPELWRQRPEVWRAVLPAAGERNTALEACLRCALSARCRWDDPGALPPDHAAVPVESVVLPWERDAPVDLPVPAAIVRKRPATPVVCVTPWTTMEIVDPEGKVRQCCSDWTVGDRGNALEASLLDLWNGPGYRHARRVMSGDDLAPLCLPICSRLHDEKFAERELRIRAGSERFVANQLLLAEELAERREVLRARPLRLALCPSTYCNYDCIMCHCGRTPRRELPASVWDELPELLPTLQSLTLLGGEPLASPETMAFLRAFDVARYPDASVDLVTNGSLLTEGALKHLRRCTLGNVTVSLNAGTAEVYERVQRGLPLERVLDNLDALLRFRETHHRWFGVTLSFVVQPAASPTLVEFGEIARARGLPVRLMALNPADHEGLDFYPDADAVARVAADVDRFIAHAERVCPSFVREARSARSAVLAEAAARAPRSSPVAAGRRRLSLVP